jgi:hypothetical protein
LRHVLQTCVQQHTHDVVVSAHSTNLHGCRVTFVELQHSCW